MSTPRPVSVVICTFNRAARLPRILCCLDAQDYPADAMEIVVIDNASTDDTAQVVAHFANSSRCPTRYVFEPQAGISHARNRGVAVAAYPFIAFIDDDCTVAADWLHCLMTGFDLSERIVAVGGLVRIAWEESRPDWFGPALDPWLADTSFLGDQARILTDDERLVEANTVFERVAWQYAGGFAGMEQFGSRNLSAGEVLLLLRNLRSQGGEIAFVPSAVADHHVCAPSRRRLIKRAYWQGVSDVLLDQLIHTPDWRAMTGRLLYEVAAIGALCVLEAVALLTNRRQTIMLQATRLALHTGALLTMLRLEGDWPRIRASRYAPVEGGLS